ncbi:hypothetical protein BKA04_001799 [Cryobacterium mesophilum]|uniref:Lipoprotein n=1 Tax=Terrimesophilobacter mesophilus TaxID=433647 RepID=A0A4V3IAE9_9MICO|nr:hypothetical protein [Terrimesophilobacter mesophilus]MBB5633576.1 hypothetical protein [Terrimesophilobacter mesophilus]TFB80278.1 hypothetical protein E3N84_09695 [Terrimesophilobacter mesophilus]
MTFAAVALVPLLLLTACQPEKSPLESPSPTVMEAPSAPPGPPVQALPPDSVLGMTGTVTADNGAELALTLVVHASKAATAPDAATGSAVITDWCAGELDANTLAGQAYGLVQVDYTATLVGSKTWPPDLPLLLFPTAQDVGLASSGAAHQIEVLAAPPSPGDYVPHCQQFAFLTGPGDGSTIVALAGDASDNPPFTRWADFAYGFDINSPAGFVGSKPFGGVDSSRVSFTNCVATITALASTLGYPSNSWGQEFAPDRCVVGGSTQPLGGP